MYFFVVNRLINEGICHIVLDQNRPGAAGIHHAAPNFASFPLPIVGRVVFESDVKGNRRTNDGQDGPRYSQPIQFAVRVQNNYERGVDCHADPIGPREPIQRSDLELTISQH